MNSICAAVNVPVLLFLTAAAASPLAAATRDAIASPHATVRELGLVSRAPIRRIESHEQHRSFQALTASASFNSIRAEATITNPSIAAPPIKAGFAAGFDEDGWYPSDAAGAVSARYVLQTTNVRLRAQDRNGALLSSITLQSFWHDPAFPDSTLYDSKVLYDAVTDRWVICTLYDVNYKKSTLLLAISDSGNPTLGWHRYRFIVDAKDDQLEADYTRMAMTRDAIVVTANIYAGLVGCNVFMVKKSDAYAGGATLPVTQVSWPGYELVPVDGRQDSTPYFIAQRSEVDFGVYTWSGQNGSVFTNVANPSNAPSPGLTFTYPAFDRYIGGQAGGWGTLECEFNYLSNAVMRDGVLWVVSHPFLASPVRSSVMWWRITMSNPLRVVTGLIDDPTGKTMYAYPSIAVNRIGGALLGYSLFNASSFPSAAYTYVDPFNSMSAPAIMKTSIGPSLFSRWADYSTTVTDPNDIDFWTTQTWVPSTMSESLRGVTWSTWWAKIEIPPPAKTHAVRR
jgi:hypothetical protein